MFHPFVAHRRHTGPKTKVAAEPKATGHDDFHLQIGGPIVRVVYAAVLFIVFCVIVWAVLQGILPFWQSFTHQLQQRATAPLGAMYRADKSTNQLTPPVR